MKFLVIGLGSMGKRRIRCLKTLGKVNVVGFDPREDRRQETEKLYHIRTVSKVKSSLIEDIDAFIISTPPDLHTPYLKLAIENNIPAFVEASVLLEDVIDIIKMNDENTFIAPSCTLYYHPIIKEIREIINSNKYGKITNFTYHSGQYLPDWHPWENVKDFYVSNRETGGGREIVPFELTWITQTIGFPEEIKGYFKKTIDFGVEIEDTYAFVLKFKDYLGSMIVDVASRFATRILTLNFEKAQLTWNWDEGAYKIYEADKGRWITFDQPQGINQQGYNKNIVEGMYVEEIEAFVSAIQNPKLYPNTLEKDKEVLKLLNLIEESDGGFKR